MLAGLFRSNQPAVLFAVPLVVAVLCGPAFSAPVEMPPGLMPLAALVERMLGGIAWAHHLLGIVLVLMVAVQLALLVNGLELMERRNHLAALLFPVLLAGLGGEALYEPALLGMPLVLIALRRAWSINNTGAALGVLFDAGFLLGLATLCYLPYAFLLVVVWASVSVIRPFAWREHVMPVLGTALVLYLTWAALHLMDRTPWRPLLTVARWDAATATVMHPTTVRWAFLVLAGLVLFVALMGFGSGYARSVMRGKNLRASFFAFATALGVLAVLLGSLNGSFPPVLAAVPLAVLCGYAFISPKRPWLQEAAVSGLVLLALWIKWAA